MPCKGFENHATSSVYEFLCAVYGGMNFYEFNFIFFDADDFRQVYIDYYINLDGFDDFMDMFDYYINEVNWEQVSRTIKSDIVDHYNFQIKEKTEKISAKKIQRAWRKCRYNPEYKMCEKIQLDNLERDTGLVLK